MPKVSIIIATYNFGRYIAEAIESILHQIFTDYEIIVIDDGSTDNTRDVVKRYGDKIRYFYHENIGAVKSRMRGLNESKGTYIATLDADDIWLPDKLKRQVEILEAYPHLDMLFSDFINFKKHGFYEKSFLDINKVFRAIPTISISNEYLRFKIFERDILSDFIRGNFILPSTLMVRKEVCVKLGMYDGPADGRDHYEFFLKALPQLSLGFIDSVLTHRRIHEKKMTTTSRFYDRTINVCQKALQYPWMDEQCQKFLKEELLRAYFILGRYYFVKGDFSKARNLLKEALRHNTCNLTAALLFAFTFIVTPSAIFKAKRIKKYFLASKNLNINFVKQ